MHVYTLSFTNLQIINNWELPFMIFNRLYALFYLSVLINKTGHIGLVFFFFRNVIIKDCKRTKKKLLKNYAVIQNKY